MQTGVKTDGDLVSGAHVCQNRVSCSVWQHHVSAPISKWLGCHAQHLFCCGNSRLRVPELNSCWRTTERQKVLFLAWNKQNWDSDVFLRQFLKEMEFSLSFGWNCFQLEQDLWFIVPVSEGFCGQATHPRLFTILHRDYGVQRATVLKNKLFINLTKCAALDDET